MVIASATRWRVSGVCLAVAGSLLLACGRGKRPGVPRNTSGQPEVWRIDSTPELVVNGGDSNAPESFKDAVGAMRFSDGRIVIGDAASNSLKFYDSTGRFLTRVSQDSTEQDLFLRWVGRCPGTSLAVAKDIRLRRLSFVSENGAIVRSMRIPRWLVHTKVVRCQSDGSVLAFQEIPLLIPKGRGLTRSQASLLRIHVDSLRVDTLSTLSGTEFYYSHRSPLFAHEPLGVEAFATFGSSSGYVGANDNRRIDVLDSTGLRARSFDLELLNQDRATVGNVLTAVATLLKEEPASKARPLMQQVFAEAPLKTTTPAYDALASDVDDNLWVRLTALPPDSTRRWALFAADGQRVGSIDLPLDFFPTDIGRQYILGVQRNLVAPESVVLYKIVRGTGS